MENKSLLMKSQKNGIFFQIQQNAKASQFLLKAIESLDISESDDMEKNLRECLDLEQNEEIKCDIQCTLGIILFYVGKIEQAFECFNETLNSLKKSDIIDKDTHYARIISNMTIFYLSMSNFSEVDKMINTLFTISQNSNASAEIVDIIMNVFFRYESMDCFSNIEYESIEKMIDDNNTLGIIYNTCALNREIFNDFEKAAFYYDKSLGIWLELDDKFHCICNLMHLIHIKERLNQPISDYKKLFDNFVNEQMNIISPESVFKNFKEKIEKAHWIIESLKEINDSRKLSKSKNKSNVTEVQKKVTILPTTPTASSNIKEKDFIPELALKLRFQRATNYVKFAEKNLGFEGANEFYDITGKIASLSVKAKSQIFKKQLKDNLYVRDSVNLLKSHTEELAKFFSKLIFIDPLSKIQDALREKKKYKAYIKRRDSQSPYVKKV